SKEDGFEYYEVQPAEGFFSIQRRFGLTKEEIIAHNPLAGDGLKAGMILKIPVEGLNEDGPLIKSTIVDLREHIKNKSKKNIALMLPLRLSRVQNVDSLASNTRLLQNDVTIQEALDFYREAIIATEDATNLGILVKLQVVDTARSPNKVSQIITSNNFKKVDAVNGPVLASDVERATRDLQRDEVEVFSNLTYRPSWDYLNLFQTLPTEDKLVKLM